MRVEIGSKGCWRIDEGGNHSISLTLFSNLDHRCVFVTIDVFFQSWDWDSAFVLMLCRVRLGLRVDVLKMTKSAGR